MRIKFILLSVILLVPALLLAGSLTYTFHFSQADLSFSTYNGYDVVSIKGGVSNQDIGKPSIPSVVANFVIPSDAEVTGVEILSNQTQEIQGAYDICPTQTPRPISKNEKIPFVVSDPSVYYQSNPYPEKNIISYPSGSMGGYRVAGILINPLKYIPGEKKLILSTEFTVRIQYANGVHNSIALTEKQRDVFAQGVKTIVLNTEDIKSFSPPVKAYPTRACDYAIITGSSYTTAWQRLADWKIAAGYTAQVFTTTWIYSNYTGYDNPEKIRNFLIDYFNNEGLIYAVLGGDNGIVPERDIYTDFYSPYNTASDYYYSDLDGTWDLNGNHQYGERTGDGVDGYFDIYVGRPPIDNTTDINSFLQKDSVYIYDPPASYIQKLLLPSVMLFSSSNYHGRVVNNAIGAMFPGWTITKLEDSQAYAPNTRNAFNQNYNFMHIAAHGDQDGTYSAYGNPVFTNSDVPSLTNTMPTIINTIACYSGDFDEYANCFAEQLLNKSGGAGCVAVAMNSRYGWGSPPQMGPSEHMDTLFYGLMLKDTLHIGIIHGATKNHFRNLIWSNGVWHYCGTELNLFGDPEMTVRLTSANEPYVYLSDKVLNDQNNNGIWDPGEYAELITTLSNGGSMDANNVQAVLRKTTNGQYVTISDSTSSFGNITVGGSANNTSDPYKMTASASTPSGTIIGFTLHITADGGYSWDVTFTLAVGNPPVDYYTHDIGNVKYTVTNRGICGFMDDGQTIGSGFHYPISGAQHLFIGSIWAGNAANYVVNRDYSAENSGDWQPVDGVYGDGTVYSDQDSWAKYDDSGMSSPKGLSCTQDGWAWSDVGGEDYVIVKYTFKNEGSSAINGLYGGQFMDWDVGDAYNDFGGVDLTRNLAYMYGSGTKYVGVGLLDPSTASNVTLVYNPQYVWNSSYVLDSDKIQFLNGSISNHNPSPDSDWSMCVAAGPFNLSPGDTVSFAVVILGGENLGDIQQNYDSAQARYPPVGVEEQPGASDKPFVFGISKVYPQPFSSNVNIQYTVPVGSKISLKVYDVSGRLVRTVLNMKQAPGVYNTRWDGKNSYGRSVTSGVYFARLTVNGDEQKATRKLLLVK